MTNDNGDDNDDDDDGELHLLRKVDIMKIKKFNNDVGLRFSINTLHVHPRGKQRKLELLLVSTANLIFQALLKLPMMW